MGPKIEPCGTPWVNVIGSESVVSIRVHSVGKIASKA